MNRWVSYLKEQITVKSILCLIGIGFVLTLGTFLGAFYFGKEGFRGVADRCILVVFYYLFIFIGATILLIVISRLLYIRRYLTQRVVATVVGLHSEYFEEDADSGSTTYYAPIWGFTYNGIEYKVQEKWMSASPKYDDGDKATIRINPNNPEEIHIGYFVELVALILGLSAVAPVMFIIQMFI